MADAIKRNKNTVWWFDANVTRLVKYLSLYIIKYYYIYHENNYIYHNLLGEWRSADEGSCFQKL